MRIEVLYFDGCPSHDAVMVRLRGLLDVFRIDQPVELVKVASPEAAEQQRFLGSPTLRIDGVDVDPGAADRTDFGLKCRLYRHPDGGQQAVPPERWIRAALSNAAPGATTVMEGQGLVQRDAGACSRRA